MPTVVIRTFVATLVTCSAVAQSGAQENVRFAQITDAHIIDAPLKPTKKGETVDDYAENRRALAWAIDEINWRNAIGAKYDFTVFTGDLGLEFITGAKNSDDKVVKVPEQQAVAEFAAVISRSSVKTWLIVPGNNDLADENPADFATYQHYVSELEKVLHGRYDIVDLAPPKPPAAAKVFSKSNCVFVGFDNSTFKKNFESEQLERVAWLESLVKAKANAHVFIFCHIPDCDDPHKKDDGTYDPAWKELSDSVHAAWNHVVTQSHVERVFAGHFHSPDRWRYLDLSWTSKSAREPKNIEKLLICPPLAVKYQVGQSPNARGFRDVHVNGDTGEVASQIVWYEATASLPSAPIQPVKGCECEKPPSPVLGSTIVAGWLKDLGPRRRDVLIGAAAVCFVLFNWGLLLRGQSIRNRSKDYDEARPFPMWLMFLTGSMAMVTTIVCLVAFAFA